MTEHTIAGPLLEAYRDDPAPRSRKPWIEQDFAAIMQACRDGATVEQIALRIGRTPNSVPQQLRRLLPLDERHLPGELALPRLRQLDADGDYDWLGALAQRERSAWELQEEARAQSRARGIGALEDEELLSIAVAMTVSVAPVQHDLRLRCTDELHRRGLGDVLSTRIDAARAGVLRRLLDEQHDGYDGRGWHGDEYP